MINNIIQKTLSLNENEFFIKHLSIVNVFLPIHLTPKEIEVLASFMSLTGEMGEDRFGTSARKLIMNRLNLSAGGLGNYLKSLRNKGFIINNKILSILHPKSNEQPYMFKLIKNDERITVTV